MAIDSYAAFIPYTSTGGSPLQSESQVSWNGGSNDPLGSDMKSYADGRQLFEIEDYSFDVEQVLNIGSQGSGLGAGKITFNPFSITRKIDRASPVLFDRCCGGQAFQQVILALRKATGVGASGNTMSSGQVFLRFDFKLVGVKTISWQHDDESPKETVTFAYGGLLVRYLQQNPDGSFAGQYVGGWNGIYNTQDHTTSPIQLKA
jgi:type VI secretion system secreted protein Hcp